MSFDVFIHVATCFSLPLLPLFFHIQALQRCKSSILKACKYITDVKKCLIAAFFKQTDCHFKIPFVYGQDRKPRFLKCHQVSHEIYRPNCYSNKLKQICKFTTNASNIYYLPANLRVSLECTIFKNVQPVYKIFELNTVTKTAMKLLTDEFLLPSLKLNIDI